MAYYKQIVELSSRRHGSSVVAANDETFGKKERLLEPAAPVSLQAHTGLTGDLYDGWETRRRRDVGTDWAIIRLGTAGIPSKIVVDTSHFFGQSPSAISVHAASFAGFPTSDDLLAAPAGRWVTLLEEVSVAPNQSNEFEVSSSQSFTHVRITIHPDGGVARLRVFGEVVIDPRHVQGMTIDLVAQKFGGLVVGCTDDFFCRPGNINAPTPLTRSEKGWESNRRRNGGHDSITLAFAGLATVQGVEVDTTYYKGNAPDSFSVDGRRNRDSQGEPKWTPILSQTAGAQDTPHAFRVSDCDFEEVKLNIYPDGGVSRFRVFGMFTQEGLGRVGLKWFLSLPQHHLLEILESPELGWTKESVTRVIAARESWLESGFNEEYDWTLIEQLWRKPGLSTPHSSSNP